MTYEKFLRRNELIASCLAQIAQNKSLVAWVETARPADSGLRELLAAQERLLTAAERMLDSGNDVPAAQAAAPLALLRRTYQSADADSH